MHAYMQSGSIAVGKLAGKSADFGDYMRQAQKKLNVAPEVLSSEIVCVCVCVCVCVYVDMHILVYTE